MDQVKSLFAKITILVVDDMETIRSVVRSSLVNLGAQNYHLEPNGALAWERANNTKIDLIISDFDMPKMTGLQLLQNVRKSPKHEHIPFLMLTAASDKNRVHQCIKAGASDYLVKPFKPKDLEYRIVKMLSAVSRNLANKT